MHNEVTTIIKLLLTENVDERPSARDVIEDKYKYLRTLRKKVNRSKSPHIPVLSLVKSRMITRHGTSKLRQDISVLLDHLVEVPPALFQIECPVCKDIVKTPHQTDCCSNNFCQTCIQQAKNERDKCPTCNQPNYSIFPDKGLQTALQHLQVYCTYRGSGCKWAGMMKQLDSHLNKNLPQGKQLEGCQFVELDCLYCFKRICRSKLKLHQSDQCPERPFNCQFCRNYISHYRDTVNNHWPKCDYYPIQCEYKCGEIVPRKDYRKHTKSECLEATAVCMYSGCDSVLARKDMLMHIISTHTYTPAKLQESICQANQLQVKAYERKSKCLSNHIQRKRPTRNRCLNLREDSTLKQTENKDICSKWEWPNPSEIKEYAEIYKSQRPTLKSLIEPPQESLLDLIECPLCLRIVTEPYQVMCCGKNLCKLCIENVKASNQQCPSCKGSMKSFLNVGLRRVLSEIYIYCPYKEKGCDWKGKLGNLNGHFNAESEYSPESCKYAEIKCEDCSTSYVRCLSTVHKTEQCSARRFTCNYCKLYKSTYEDVATNHWHVCKHYLIKCPRKCGMIVKRQHLTTHLHNQCLLRQQSNWLSDFLVSKCHWVFLLLLCVCAVFLLAPTLYSWLHFQAGSPSPLSKFKFGLNSQELAVYNQESNEICQEWKFNTFTVTVSLSKSCFEHTSIITCEVRNTNPEWNEEFEFHTVVTVVSTELLRNRGTNLNLIFTSTRALQNFQEAINQA